MSQNASIIDAVLTRIKGHERTSKDKSLSPQQQLYAHRLAQELVWVLGILQKNKQ